MHVQMSLNGSKPTVIFLCQYDSFFFFVLVTVIEFKNHIRIYIQSFLQGYIRGCAIILSTRLSKFVKDGKICRGVRRYVCKACY